MVGLKRLTDNAGFRLLGPQRLDGAGENDGHGVLSPMKAGERPNGRSIDYADFIDCQPEYALTNNKTYITIDLPHKNRVVASTYGDSLMSNGKGLSPAIISDSPDIVHVSNAGEQTMSSREIAELTGKAHKNVLADIDKMLISLGLKIQPGSYTDSNGDPRRCFDLPKRETLILVSGYNVQMRARIIDRWQELEAREAAVVAPINFRDPALLLGVLTDLQEQVAEKDAKIAVMKPKEEFFDGYVSSDGLYNLSDGARLLSDKPNVFLRNLRSSGYLRYNNRGCQVPYAIWRGLGLFDVKVSQYRDPKTGELVATSQTFFTPKGIEYFTRKFPRTVRPKKPVLIASTPHAQMAA
jgi:phage antirepressor YoqD-like protein